MYPDWALKLKKKKEIKKDAVKFYKVQLVKVRYIPFATSSWDHINPALHCTEQQRKSVNFCAGPGCSSRTVHTDELRAIL